MGSFDIVSLRRSIAEGRRPSILLFWGHRSRDGAVGKHVLSQWWPARFSVDGVTYPTAEHYMMAEKARLFGDEEMCRAILAAPDPSRAKALGRRVRGYDDGVWESRRFDIVVAGNRAKFTQNAALGKWLLATGSDVLAEASPVDAIWGIGLAESDPRARDPLAWPGLNLLGFAHMAVRAELGRINSSAAD